MFDNFPRHVRNVERAIWAGGEGYGTKPIAAAGQKFGGHFIGCAFRTQRAINLMEDFAMHQIAADITDERIALKLGGKGIAPIDMHTAGRSEISGRPASALDETRNLSRDPPACPDHPPCLLGTCAVDGGGGTVGGNVQQGCVGRVELAHVSHFPRHPLEMMTVTAEEAPTTVIEAEAKLRGACFRQQSAGKGIPGKITTIQLLSLHFAAIARSGSPEGTVFTPRQTVGKCLDVEVFPSETRGDNPAFIGNTVAIAVVRENQIRRCEDINAVLRTCDARWPGKVFDKDRRCFEQAIVIAIRQFTDGAELFLPALRQRVIAHFHDIQSTLRIECHRNRSHYIGFGGRQLHLKSRPQGDRPP